MDSLKTIFFASCLTCLLFVSSYLHMNSFYSLYGVDIKQWIDWDEWVPLSFPGLLDQLWSISVISVCCSGALYFQKMVKENSPQSNAVGWRIKLVCAIVYIGFAFLMVHAIFSFETNDSKLSVTPLFIFPVFLTGSYLLFAHKISIPILKRLITRANVVFTIVLLSVFIHPLTYGNKTARGRIKSEIYTTAHLRNEKYDSLIYLGSTRRQFFLFSKKERTTLIFRKDLVDRIEMVDGNSKLLIR